MLRTILLAVATLAAAASGAPAQPTATSFTYQGDLKSGGSPASGLHDLRFTLFDGPSGGAALGSTVCMDDVPVVDGRFTVTLDFGNQFASPLPRWLLIEVRADPAGATTCAIGTGFTPLSPRQALTSAPASVFARSVDWGSILSMPSGFADGVDNGFTVAGQGLTASGNSVSLDLTFSDGRYFQHNTYSLAGDVGGYVFSTTVNALKGKFLAASAANPQHNDVLTWDINQGGWAPKPTQHWTPGQGLQQITGSYAVDYTVLDARYLGQNPILGGDLSGVAGAATVTGLQGRPISATAPAPTQVLKWNGAQWAPAADTTNTYTAGTGLTLISNQFSVNVSALSPSFIDENQSFGGDVSGLFNALTVNRIKGRDVTALAPAVGDVLQWTGAIWNVVPSSGLFSAGAGLNLAASVFSIPNNGVTPAMLASDAAGLNRVTGGNAFIQSNNMAVGAGTPTEKLSVFGNLRVAGNITTTGSVTLPATTRHWSGAAHDWSLSPTSPGTNVVFTSNGWNGPNNATVYIMEQSVHLPHGAAVTALEFYALDNNGNNFIVDLIAVPHNGAAPVVVATVSSSSSTNAVISYAGAVSATIDNTVNAYGLRATWNPGSQPANMRLHGAHISYSVTAPLP